MAEQRDGTSPPGRERAEQEIRGRAGGGQGEGGAPRGQNRQGSQRAETKTEGRTAGGFRAGHAPSEQGRGEPRPDTIAGHQAGMKPRAGHQSKGKRTEEAAQAGEPRAEHPRGGRQDVPGNRDPKRSR